MIPRASVLDKLKDEMSGKVLEFDWGVGQWAGLLLSSNVDHPVDLEDPALFEPRLLGDKDSVGKVHKAPLLAGGTQEQHAVSVGAMASDALREHAG